MHNITGSEPIEYLYYFYLSAGGVTMAEQLLPCPFCGGNALPARELRGYLKPTDIEAYAYFYRCHACAAEGGWSKSATGAVRLWNMRTKQEASHA